MLASFVLCPIGTRIAHVSRRCASRSASAVLSAVVSLVSHSQIIRTLHPAAFSASSAARSRAIFASNFAAQKSVLVFGVVAPRQPACRCQKHPCTKIAIRWRGRTMSGRPGRSRRWRRKRYPMACRARRTANSGFVFVPFTLRMSIRRASGTSEKIFRSVMATVRLPAESRIAVRSCHRNLLQSSRGSPDLLMSALTTLAVACA